MIVGDLSIDDWQHRMTRGVVVRIGPFTVRMTVRLREVADAMYLLYRDYPIQPEPIVLDFDVAALPISWWGRGPRMAALYFDGVRKFDPIEREQALPMFQWLLNWCIFTHPHQYLILHSAVVARDDMAAVLPGMPGAGKSTLCTALVHGGGWRLLSDEVALVTPSTGLITPAPLPIGLKEESIPVIAATYPHARMGPSVRGTRKGTVVHIATPASSMAAASEAGGGQAQPRWIIFPEYHAGARVQLEPAPRANAFMTIAADAFNYSLLGATGYETLANVVDACHCFNLQYSQLDDAIAVFDQLASQASSAASSSAGSLTGSPTGSGDAPHSTSRGRP